MNGDTYKLEKVFTPGGQPTVTYVSRDSLSVEKQLTKAISQPNLLVSLTGPTKAGKTVLCRKVLEQFHFVWIDGGQVKSEPEFWEKLCYELNVPLEMKGTTANEVAETVTVGGEVGAEIPFVAKVKAFFTTSGSKLNRKEFERTYRIDSQAQAVDHLISNDLVLVIDDFHYLPVEARLDLLRSLKGAIFSGLKVVMLSVSYRAFDALKAEPELTGRLRHIEVPEWEREDLSEIATKGFAALGVTCPDNIVGDFSTEAFGSPLLMQKFCWELCYENGVQSTGNYSIEQSFPLGPIYKEIARDSGLPIYQRLAAGPVTRTPRMGRPLRLGGTADIYQAILLAIAHTGPKRSLTYDEIRASLNKILSGSIPQRLEVSNALNHLSKISGEISEGIKPIDWDEESRILNVMDPYFRFYMRWHVRGC